MSEKSTEEIVVDLAALDCYFRHFPFKKVIISPLKEDQAIKILEDYLLREGYLEHEEEDPQDG